MTRLQAFGVVGFSLAAFATAHDAQPIWGSWGGQHIGLVIGTVDSAVEYDCAEGTFYGPVVPRADGSFVAEGTHTPGHGGPSRLGEVLPSYAATYRGKWVGGDIILEVDVEGHGTLGPFKLSRNQVPMLTRCL